MHAMMIIFTEITFAEPHKGALVLAITPPAIGQSPSWAICHMSSSCQNTWFELVNLNSPQNLQIYGLVISWAECYFWF